MSLSAYIAQDIFHIKYPSSRNIKAKNNQTVSQIEINLNAAPGAKLVFLRTYERRGYI